jgi:hypothetical protein
MKAKTIRWSVISVLTLAIAVGAVLWLSRPQVILLKDGTKLTLVGVTHGRHHVPPKIKMAGTHNRGVGNAIESDGDSLVVWIESESRKKGPNQWPNYQLFVYDSAETAYVSTWSRSTSELKNGVYIQGYLLEAYPRRERRILLRVGAWNNMGGGMQVAKGEFAVPNPARGKTFSTWAEDSIPDTQSDGDLDVTLTKLIYDAPGFGPSRGAGSKDAMNKAVRAAFHCEQKGVTVTNWQVMQIETSDATGNHVQNRSWSTSRDDSGDATMTYQYGLWPDVTPWKLRVEMSRTSGFNSDEVWEVSNVPVQTGTQNDLWNYNQRAPRNAPFSEMTLNGIHLKLFPAVQIADQNSGGMQQGGVRVATEPDLPPGYRLSILVTDEQGRPLSGWGPNGGGRNYVEQIQELRGKTLTVTVALHKSRFVEFTVKPAKNKE